MYCTYIMQYEHLKLVKVGWASCVYNRLSQIQAPALGQIHVRYVFNCPKAWVVSAIDDCAFANFPPADFKAKQFCGLESVEWYEIWPNEAKDWLEKKLEGVVFEPVNIAGWNNERWAKKEAAERQKRVELAQEMFLGGNKTWKELGEFFGVQGATVREWLRNSGWIGEMA